MKRLSLLFILAILSSFRAIGADYSALIDSKSFKLLIVQSMPSHTGEEPVYYDGQSYYIRFNGDNAIFYIPGVNRGGCAVFGGGYSEGETPETTVMKIKSCVRKRRTTKFILESLNSIYNYEVHVRVNDNGTADVTVRYGTYSGHSKFLARIAE